MLMTMKVTKRMERCYEMFRGRREKTRPFSWIEEVTQQECDMRASV